MAFVLVQHLDPDHESMLPDILSRVTPMPVRSVEHQMKIEANSVYVIPPNFLMQLDDGRFTLLPRVLDHGRYMPVDQFLHSLAENYKTYAIGVVLSGTNSDGTLGLKAIKSEGGVTFAQDPITARFSGMPQAAVSAGCVDLVLPPEKIAGELVRLSRHPLPAPLDEQPEKTSDDERAQLARIFSMLRAATKVDFSGYRLTTIQRRIARRLLLHQHQTLEQYVRRLREDPHEIEALYEDLLITVTAFFRDPETFDLLSKTVFPEILSQKRADLPIRIWVPGCSTGEEVYSIAIVLFEALAPSASFPSIQIFATDVSESAIEKARMGLYMENSLVNVSSDRLRRFFSKTDGGYRIAKRIRDVCVFARQNVAVDPPFSSLDLLSCRNLLIYLEPTVQKRILPLFHYALRPNGYLMLGPAETIGLFSELFQPIDKTHRIFRKKSVPARAFPALGFPPPRGVPADVSARVPAAEIKAPSDLAKEADKVVLGRYAPPGVVVSADLDVLQFRGRTSPYLETPADSATFNLLKMAREGLFVELRAAVQKAKKTRRAVRLENVAFRSDGRQRRVNVEVLPMGEGGPDDHFLIVFQEPPGKPSRLPRAPARARTRKTGQRADQLQRELAATRDYLQAIIEEQEASNEELKSSNEEIQSSNEELQSTNEELETAKEELQSTNEELQTVNDELQNRNVELADLSNDLTNLFSSVNIPIVMLGPQAQVRRFTPMAERLLNLRPSDVGRPVNELRANIAGTDLAEFVREVIDTVTVRERELQDADGHWYLMRVRPYRTHDNRIDGAVVAFLDIDPVKRSLEQASRARLYAETLVETIRESLIVLDRELRVTAANQAFYAGFRMSPVRTEGNHLWELKGWEWTNFELRRLLENVVLKDERIVDREIERDFESVGRKTLLVNARQIAFPEEPNPLLLLAIEDISKRKLAERELRASETRYRQIFESAREGIWIQDADSAEILDVNPHVVEFLGFPRGELIGRRPWELALYNSPEEIRAAFQELRKTGFSFAPDVPMTRQDGSTVVIESISTAYMAGTRRVVQTNMRDVTERKRLEEELRQAQKMDSIGRLAGGLAHDFNNILNIIAAYAGILERDVEPRKKAETLEAIQNAVQRGAGVVRQLLTFARKEEISFQPTDLNQIVRECAKMISETFPKRITILVELARDLPLIHGDSTQLHQALLNLCVNARDAIDGTGSLTLMTERVEGQRLVGKFPEATENVYACMCVTDSGKGIDPSTRSRIFDPFFTTKGAGGGSGLGLPVVYGIVRGHGGFIDVKSEPGKGAVFQICLPVGKQTKGRPAEPEEKKKAPSPSGGSEKVLLVDDEEMLLASVRSLLEAEGYSVLTARDGVEAVEVFGRNASKIDLVVLDLELPRLSGWEAFLRIRKINPQVRAILASGYADLPIEKEMRKRGASAFLRKPYTGELLLAQMRRLLSRPRRTARPRPRSEASGLVQ